ncbi:hypothetical protein OAN58_04350 [Paracoccaceae bacterium]|nr:hypothetical protein [Paracoccaceae bacterium]
MRAYVLCLLISALFSLPNISKANDLNNILQLFSTLAATQQVQQAAKEWKSADKTFSQCMLDAITKHNLSLEQLIQNGYGPKHPELKPLADACNTIGGYELKTNVTCTHADRGKKYNTWCDEAFVLKTTKRRLTKREAWQATFNNSDIELSYFERIDAEKRRLEMIRIEPSQSSVPVPNFNCAKAKSKSEITVCSSYALSMLDFGFGGIYRETVAKGEKSSANKIANEEYKRTEACAGRENCIKLSKESAIDALDDVLTIAGYPIETLLDVERRKRREEEEEKRKKEEEEARKIAEEKRKKEEEERRKREAEQKRLEKLNKALIAASTEKNRLLDTFLGGDMDAWIIVNESKSAPNLVRNLADQVVSASGKAVICYFVTAIDREEEETDRFFAFAKTKENYFIGDETERLINKSVDCIANTSFDYLIYQKQTLSDLYELEQAAPEEQLRHILKTNEVLSKIVLLTPPEFTTNLIFTDDMAVLNEIEFHETQKEKQEEEEKKLAEEKRKREEEKRLKDEQRKQNILAQKQLAASIKKKLASGAIEGAGVLFTDKLNAHLCYAADDELNDLKLSSTPGVVELIRGPLKETYLGEELKLDALEVKEVSDLERIFLNLQTPQNPCQAIFASNKFLTILISALDRREIPFSVAPIWFDQSGLDEIMSDVDSNEKVYRDAGFANKKQFDETGFTGLEQFKTYQELGYSSLKEFEASGFKTLEDAKKYIEAGYENMAAFKATGFRSIKQAMSLRLYGTTLKGAIAKAGQVSLRQFKECDTAGGPTYSQKCFGKNVVWYATVKNYGDEGVYLDAVENCDQDRDESKAIWSKQLSREFSNQNKNRCIHFIGTIRDENWTTPTIYIKEVIWLETDKEKVRRLATQKRREERQQKEEERARIALIETNKNNAKWLSDEYGIKAGLVCKPKVEALAKYTFRWTDTWTESKFPSYVTVVREPYVLTISGDKIEMQNGFGAFVKTKYYCHYNTKTGEAKAEALGY